MGDHSVERERFQVAMEAEGMPREISRRILRRAQTIQRCAELECSSEAADRDQVRCPAGGKYDEVSACLCKDYGSLKPCRVHGTVPRYMVTSARAERLIEAWCAKASVANGYDPQGAVPIGHFEPIFSGDPRGACVKIKVPSGRNDSWGGEGAICVPTR